MLSSQRGGLCQLLSYCLPAPAPPFHTQLWDARAGPLKTTLFYQLGPSQARQQGAPEGDCKGWGGGGACSLVPASCWLWFPVLPSNTASPWRQQFLPVQQLNQVCHFSSTYRTILIMIPLRNTITSCPAPTPQRSGFQLWGSPCSKHLRFNNTISTLGPPSSRADGCFLQPLPP